MERYLSTSGDTTAVNSPDRQKLKAKRVSKHVKGSSSYSSSNGNTKRKSLQILQPSANHQSMLVGVDGVITTSVKTKKKSGKRKVLGDGNEGRPRKLSRSNEDGPQENDTSHNKKGTGTSSGRETNSGRSNRTGDKRMEKTQEQHQKFSIYEDPSSSSSESDQEKKRTQDKFSKTAEEEAYELMVQEPAPDSYWKQLAEQRREALEDTLKENEQLHDEVANLKEENDRLRIMADQAEYLASVVQELMGEEDDDKPKDNETTQESNTEQSNLEQIEEENHDEGTESTDSIRSDDSDL